MATRGMLSLILLVGTSAVLQAQQVTGGTGIIYGPNHAFSVTAPAGWILDNQAGKADGLHAVFYRPGESWQNAEAAMYVNTGEPAVDSVMRYDSLRFLSQRPGLRVTARDAIRTADSVTAPVRQFVGDPSGNVEAVAYVPQVTVTAIIVLTARTRQAFENALPAFAELVRSCHFISSHVEIK